MARPTSATIHTDALRHNLGQLRARAPGSRVMAVVKADGYGHGLERVARALGAADAFGVAALSDAERLRAAGLSQPIVLLSGINEPDDIARVRELGVESVVHHHSQLEMLEQAPAGAPVRCWLKVDSGMHRLGFAPEGVRDAHARLEAAPAVAADIVLMNHFASSDEFEGDNGAGRQTREQLRVFAEATAGLPGARSLANSAGVLGWPQAHADWIRPGGALYGMSVVAGTTGADFGLRPAMTLATRLIAINPVRRGEHIGYSATSAKLGARPAASSRRRKASTAARWDDRASGDGKSGSLIRCTFVHLRVAWGEMPGRIQPLFFAAAPFICRGPNGAATAPRTAPAA